MKKIRALALLLVICTMTPFVVGFTGTPSAGCSTENISQYAPDVVDFSREIANIIRPKNPDKAAEIDKYVGYANSFYEEWQKGEASGLAVLPLLLDSFDHTIRPLLDPNNTALQIAAAGFDFAARKFARRWQQGKNSIQQSDAQVAVAKTTARAKGISLESADKTVKNFLRAPKIEKPK